MKYSHVIFDLDGTLSESGIGIIASFKYALSKLTDKTYDEGLFSLVIGPPLVYSFKEYFGLDEEQVKMAVEYYRERYSVTGIFETRMYDGVFSMLKRLKESGVKIMLATSKPEHYAHKILAHFEIDSFFDFVGGASMDSSRNTKDDVLAHTLSQAQGVDKSQILMVGDRNFDLNSAALFGVDGAGVLYGYGDFDELNACPHVILAKTAEELCDFILKSI